MRINQFLAHFSGLSRRKADKAIDEARVKVNGQPAAKGQTISEKDSVILDNKAIKKGKYNYVLFNKPIGYVTSREQQGNDPTIYELLPEALHSLKPVGRLDKDTSGLLLLTNDGDYADQLTHPRHQKLKIYHLTLDTIVDASNLAIIQGPGIELEDGMSQMAVKSLSLTKPIYKIYITEGRNRQIRRTFEHLGYTVKKLHRTNFGPFALEQLKTGTYHPVDKIDLEDANDD